MTIEVSTFDLAGEQLDWAVAQVAQVKYNPKYLSAGGYRDGADVWSNWFVSNFRPSTKWQDAGPLIERFWKEITAELFDWHGYKWAKEIAGCELVWFCRALVCAKFGSHVSIPEELA